MKPDERYTCRSICGEITATALCKDITSSEAICQLADYEDTGLSPEEVQEMIHNFTDVERIKSSNDASFFDLEKLNKLAQMRSKFGNNNQILVCIEELNELATVLAKYPRYDNPEQAVDELRTKVLDEVADVNIILQHVYAIFNFTYDEIQQRIDKKMSRVSRWVENGKTMQETIDDRKV